MLSGGLPMRRGVAADCSCRKKTMPFSVDLINDAVYINDIDYGDKYMPKDAIISAQILAKIAEGMDVVEAMRAVCGADKVDAMISDLYDQLRAKA